MRMMMAGLALMLSASPLVAQTQADKGASTPKEEKVCRRTEQTGSRMGSKRICHTASEWQAIDAEAARGDGGSNLRSKSN